MIKKNNWQIGDIVKIGNIKQVKVMEIGQDKNLRNSYILQSLITSKKYKYSFGKGIERID